MSFIAFLAIRNSYDHNIENSCKSRTSAATMVTTMPTTLNMLFALFLPARVNSIEPAADAKTINDIDDVFIRNVGKYDEKIFTFSS